MKTSILDFFLTTPSARFTGLYILLLLLFTPVAAWAQITEDAKLTASDGASDNYFGYAVSLSADAALIGAPCKDGSPVPGKAYIFRYDDVAESWQEEVMLSTIHCARGGQFGRAVSLDGSVALIGAPKDDENGIESGSAFIFRFDAGTGTWTEEAKLLPSNGAAGDQFGFSVALWRDMAVIGAPFSRDTLGSAYVFRYDHGSGTWQEEANLKPSLSVSDNDNFGWSVATTGLNILLGGPGYDHWLIMDEGAVAVFRYDDTAGQWDEGYEIMSPMSQDEYYFGYSVALSGDVAFIGEPWADSLGYESGSAHVHRYNHQYQAWFEEDTPLPPDGESGDNFGWSVSLFNDLAVAGAPHDSIFVTDVGSAYTFRYQDSVLGWTYENKLVASDGELNDRFGRSLAMFGETILCGSLYDDDHGSNSGSAYVFGTPGKIEFQVPGDFSSIQEAIDAAPTLWCEIVVDPGTYVENIDFRGKDITLRSSNGPEQTVIDGSQAGPVVTFSAPCKDGAAIDGFTIMNGYSTEGGSGIQCQRYSMPAITNCLIVGNSTSYNGGGIECEMSDALISHNVIAYNIADGSGGGIYAIQASPEISANIIFGNISTAALGSGGGIVVNKGDPVLFNNLIVYNSAAMGGGVMMNDVADLFFLNNTVTGNTANSRGGLYFMFCDGSITNSIVWGNAAPSDPQIGYLGTQPTAVCCDVEGGWPGTGNIDADPLFADAAAGDYHLTWNSPCRDTGDSAAPGLPAEDIEGDPRPAFGLVDMGVDEFHYHIYHVGDVILGSQTLFKVVGEPSSPASLALSSGRADPPLPTPFGDLHVALPLIWSGPVGTLPGSGILSVPVTIPTGWSAGEQYYLQGLVGNWGVPGTKLTNLDVLTVK